MRPFYNRTVNRHYTNSTIHGVAHIMILVSTIIVLVMIITGIAHASPVVGFEAGKIIDDGVFTNSASMNTSQIQDFLNSKVSACDTNGTQPASDFGRPDLTHAQYASLMGWSPPPYTCLKDYSENNLAAAQIIYNTSQQFQINPEVLIVLLQKEQGLVTDTWPLATQYRTATGYGCPDSTPGVCNTSYYGFTNQITLAAKLFRGVLDSNPSYFSPYTLGYNTVQYNPNSACGSSVVNIQNRSTQALYDYTPYQPNTASLAAGYGMGDSCSSYGNRNFYLYFTDWFGSVRYMFGSVPSYQSIYAQSSTISPVFDSTYVARLYNPDSRDFLYTTSQQEASVAIKYGYIWDGLVFQNASGDPTSVPIYRLSNNERHLFTASTTTRDLYINSYGYKSEGVGFYEYSSSATDRIPVYGEQQFQTVFLTSAAKEAEYYQSNYNYSSLGVLFYTKALNLSQTPVYRMSKANARFYTINSQEKAYALSLGYTDEGIVASADTYPDAANTPVYRLISPQGIHFYTISRSERDAAVINSNYIDEGIVFYTLLYSNTPIYRSTNYQNNLRIYTNSSIENLNAAIMYGFKNEGVGWYSY